MSRSKSIWVSGALLFVLMAALVLWAPLLTCPACSGVGSITVMASHPEAMGSARSAGSLVELGCPTCEGKTRVTLLQRSMGDASK